MTDGLCADAQAGSGAQLLQTVQPGFFPADEHVRIAALGGTEINELVNVVLRTWKPKDPSGD